MQIDQLPFNIDLLMLKDQDVKNMSPIKVLDIFDGFSKNFHSEGLFSSEIFGKVGEERRNRLFSYIDLKLDIFHPILFKAILDLKSLYGEILAGSAFVKWDPQLKDFIKSDPNEGETGFAYFMKYLPDIKFEERPSAKREFNIKLIDKYRTNPTFNKLVVLPAGLRDYEVDENGKPSEDEINGLYRTVFSIASIIDNVNMKVNNEYLDTARYNLQISVNKIYAYIANMLEGKRKLILGKWGSRKIFNSTRNVITSYTHDISELNGDQNVSTNQTVVGLYQYMRTILPLAVKLIRDGYLSDIFVGPNSPAVMVNKKTLKKEVVHIDPEYYDEWMTSEGLEKVMARFGQVNLRHDYLEVKDHYFGLLYKGPDNTFKFIQDIDDVPEGRSKEDVKPITFTELLYLSVFRDSDKTPCLVTRYPITGYGSIYPSYVYLKTTVRSEVRSELSDSWITTTTKAIEFPIWGEQFFDSVAPAVKSLSRLGADFDGDTVSTTSLMTEDAKKEINKLLSSRDFYVGVNGKVFFSSSTDVIELVLANITMDV